VHGTAATARARRLPVVLALALVVLGVIATLVRLDAPSDGSVLWFGSSTWSAGGAVVDVPDPAPGPGLQLGDRVTAIAGHRLADGLGTVARPGLGETLSYEVASGAVRTVRVTRTDPSPLIRESWGGLVLFWSSASSRSPCICGVRTSRRPRRCSCSPPGCSAAP